MLEANTILTPTTNNSARRIASKATRISFLVGERGIFEEGSNLFSVVSMYPYWKLTVLHPIIVSHSFIYISTHDGFYALGSAIIASWHLLILPLISLNSVWQPD